MANKTDAELKAQAEKHRAMNEYIRSKLTTRSVTVIGRKAVDPVKALHAEVRELRRDLARSNGEVMPDTLDDEATMDDVIRAALKGRKAST